MFAKIKDCRFLKPNTVDFKVNGKIVDAWSLQLQMDRCVCNKFCQVQCLFSLRTQNIWHFILKLPSGCSGPGSVVSIATGYGLDGPGIESWRGRDFPHLSRLALGANPASCTMGTGSFLGVKSGRGLTLTPHPLLVPWSWKGRAIPLLPLWVVQPVQSLSACTGVHFTFFLPLVVEANF